MRRRVWRHGTVSAVGFGCMSFGGFYGPTNEAESMRALARALDLGVDFWDTANVYGDGLCEQLIGKFLAEDTSRRSRVTLATKFAIRRRDDGARFFDNSAAHIREALEGSLKRLGVDHIDLYYVHRVDKAIPIEDTVGELARLVKAGAIGAIGLSEVAPDTLRRAHAVHPIAAVQSEYSLWTRNPELGLIQACAEAGAILVAFSPLGRGYLSGLLQNVETFGDKDFRHANPRFQGVNWRRNRDRLDAYLKLAKSWGVKPATLAIAWTLARAPHIVPIPGTRTADSSRGMRRGGRHRSDRGAARRHRARAAGRLRRRRALFRPAMGGNPEVLRRSDGRAERRCLAAQRNANGPLSDDRRTARVCPRADDAPARLDERREIVLRPLLDVVFQEMVEHRRVALAALLNGISRARFSAAATASVSCGLTISAPVELLRRAGELRQHQHAGIVRILRREILLGDEIHAVAQRRHHGDVGGAIKAGQNGARIGPVDVADRRPGRVAETAVDLADEAGHLGFRSRRIA